MNHLDTGSAIESLDQQSCLALLATKGVGRIGFVRNGGPEILPVNYVLDGDAVVFATATGAKLWGVTRSPVVFEVDDADPATRSGWSVVLHGVAHEVIDTDGSGVFDRVRASAPRPWPAGDRPHLVRITPHRMTGRRIPPEPR
jgi:nitroimidazol reductase NimA-like FMN-containing flavoprotein (pyridoxamine 5'-phosphate oxidase superfamily)